MKFVSALRSWRRRRAARSLGVFGILTVVVACGGDGPTKPGVGNAPGTYALFSISGAALPVKYTYQGADATGKAATFADTYTSGSMVLNASSEFTFTTIGTTTVNDTGPKAFNTGFKGTYQLFGSGQIRLIGTKLFFNGGEFETDPDTTTANISDTEITVVDADTTGAAIESYTYLFRKQ